MASFVKDSTTNLSTIVNYYKTKQNDINSLVKSWENDDTIKKHSFYEPFKINHLQQYNPIYSVFFELNEKNYNSITFNHKYHIQNLKEIVDLKTGVVVQKDVFIKFSPLIDSLRYMSGKYISLDLTKPDSLKLPQLKDIGVEYETKTVENKLFSIHNASYIDCFFYYLSSILLNKYNIVHGIDFYGSYLGIQEFFKVNIEEDTEYLENFAFFNANIDKLFHLENWKNQNENSKGQSHKNKKKIQILENTGLCNELEFCILPESGHIGKGGDLNISSTTLKLVDGGDELVEMYTKPINENTSDSSMDGESTEDDDSSDGSDGSHRSDGSDSSDKESTQEGDDEDDEDDNDDDVVWGNEMDDNDSTEWEDEDGNSDKSDNIENETYSYIKNFPVQMICMEKCDGTLDELFMNDFIDEVTGISAMFQIIMTLIIYQEVFDFTHNDLHTNNIAYVNTEETHLYYKYKGIVYRVPTYGRIYKIIDFGRAIYKFQNKTFCSDSFSSHGDASTQYNFPPFYNAKKPLVLPNYSFDLCRLGCSIYDFVIEENTATPVLNNMDKFQRLIHEWCLDDKGKNILYKKTGQERFSGFKLYKAISHKVTRHTPQNQLQKTVFRKFVVSNKNNKKPHTGGIIDIDAILLSL